MTTRRDDQITAQSQACPRASADQRGSALVMVLMFALVVTAVGSTMVISANTEHVITANQRDSERALFASEAGLAYGYERFRAGVLRPTLSGTPFTSLPGGDSPVNIGLDGGGFSGALYDLSAETGKGALYRIDASGVYNNARRTTQMTFMVVTDAFRYGYLAFNEATLHNHSGLAGPTFKIKSTIFSNNTVQVPSGITIDGTVVSGGQISTTATSTVLGDVYGNSIGVAGTVNGDARVLSVVKDAANPASPAITDELGKGYDWWAGRSTPGALSGGGTVLGTRSSYTIQPGDEFRYNLFRQNGTLMDDPDLNVVKYVAPPLLDYAAMKREALLNDNTFFTSMTAAMTYIMTKAADEVIEGKTVRIARVGTVDAPEFLYVQGDFTVELKGRTGTTSLSGGALAIDALWLEGGVYATGDIELNGPTYDYPAKHPFKFQQFIFNALPYCYPALLAYTQPAINQAVTPIELWSPTSTPVMAGNGSSLKMSSSVSPNEGFTFLNGLTLSQNDTHFHHTKSDQELIRFNGAELGWKLHNCDYFDFSYDPKVACTRFLVGGVGDPQVISYREVR